MKPQHIHIYTFMANELETILLALLTSLIVSLGTMPLLIYISKTNVLLGDWCGTYAYHHCLSQRHFMD